MRPHTSPADGASSTDTEQQNASRSDHKAAVRVGGVASADTPRRIVARANQTPGVSTYPPPPAGGARSADTERRSAPRLHHKAALHARVAEPTDTPQQTAADPSRL